MRSLIDMAAERGAFIDQSQSLNLFVESPTIGKLSSMYLHAWKQGLKTTYYLRSRPATRITQTTSDAPTAPARRRRSTSDAEAVACSLENPETLRGLRLMAIDRDSDLTARRIARAARRRSPPRRDAGRDAAILDPGLDLTLRPMRYPEFYDLYRDAITQHLDGRGDRLLRRPRRPAPPAAAGRAAPDQPPGRVLRHRRLDRRQQPGAQPLQAHQRARGPAVPVAPALRGGAARPVLPDAARHLPPRSRTSAPRRSPRSRTSRRSAPRPSSASRG